LDGANIFRHNEPKGRKYSNNIYSNVYKLTFQKLKLTF
jgi:hypothetical protein